MDTMRRRRVMHWMSAMLVIGMAAYSPALPAAEEAAKPAQVENGMDVGLEYTLTVDGAVVDSTDGKPSFHYRPGQHQVIPGLERQLAGWHVGDSQEVTVTPEEGYGTRDPAALVEVPTSNLPAGVTPAVGMRLRGRNADGRDFQAVISEVKEKTVMLDLNHPLAGKTLLFKVKVTAITPAPPSQPPAAPAAQ